MSEIETEFQFIRFTKLVRPDQKTDVWFCANIHSHAALGVVKWYGPWRGYCFFTGAPLPGELIFSVGCLADISKFIKSLMAERKSA